MESSITRRDAMLATTAATAALAAPALAQEKKPKFEFGVRDIVWSNIGGKPRLARVYQPQGDGPFPLVVQIHGGAWNNKDRTDGQNTSLDLCAAGIAVVSIDFRNGPEAPYPASLADINLGIRWAKAHAGEFGSTADRVGLYGTSSGGHQVLLAAIRPEDPRYRIHALPEAPNMDAKVAFTVSGWGVLYPLVRRDLAKARGDATLVKSHETFFGTDEIHLEATPTLVIERGEKVFLPPALVFQGDKDEWTSVELARRLETAWKKGGGTFDLFLAEGERHTFVNDHPFNPNSIKAVKATIEFIKKHAGAAKT
jgi:acetyl esterase/lipase